MIEEREMSSVPEGTTITFQHYSGPVAHPDIGKGWENVVRGGGDRVLGLAEAQGAHRRHVEKVVVWGRTIGSNIGTLGGIAVVMLAMYFGYDLLMHDKEVAGYSAFFLPLATLVWAYRRETRGPESPKKSSTPAPRGKSRR